MNNDRISQIFEILSKTIRNPKIELNYNSNFELLIAVILSAQSTDKSVNKVTKALFELANTPTKMIKLSEKEIKEHIKTIGLYNSKASNIIKTCKILIEKFNSKIPSSRNELEQLPGVGRKTANVILNVAFNKATIAVDTHVFRVANRLGITKSKNPLDTEKQLLHIVPKRLLKNASMLLVMHGRYVCTAKTPKCNFCELKNLCCYANKT